MPTWHAAVTLCILYFVNMFYSKDTVVCYDGLVWLQAWYWSDSWAPFMAGTELASLPAH